VESVNTPPAEAGGFGLRLKAGLIGHPADDRRDTMVKSLSGSAGCWLLMDSFHASSVTLPLDATQSPLPQSRRVHFVHHFRCIKCTLPSRVILQPRCISCPTCPSS